MTLRKWGFFVNYEILDYNILKETFTSVTYIQMKKLINKIKNHLKYHLKKSIKVRKIERSESHFNRGQTTKILTIWFFFLFGYFMLVPPTPTTNTSNEQLVFQFHGSASDWWVADAQSHGAADRWGYLFDGATGSQTFSGTVTTTTTTTTSTSTPTWTQATVTNVNAKGKYAKIITEITIPNYYVAAETLIFSRDLAIYYLEHFLEGDRSKLFVTTVGDAPKNCLSPAGDSVVLHGDFMIAYQQRADVTTICNVEKRYCNDGTLLGSYTQEFCEEKTPYEYEKVIPTSENEFIWGEYIQPNPPANANGNFNSQGQLNAPLDPTTRWDAQPADAIVVNNAWVEQTLVTSKNCRAPRGEKVLNNQFVRAYKTNVWYFNRPCEVEIRMCMDGHLKWSFKYKACAYTGASYEMAHGSN